MPVIIEGVFDQTTLCTFMLELCNMDQWKAIDVKDWVQDLVSTKPANLRSNNVVNNLYKEIKSRNLKKEDLVPILMVTDLHIDFDYKPGSSNVCTD